jgi:hypothetical protein
MKLNKIKPVVEKLLISKEELKNDDLRLIANVWYSEIMDAQNMSAFEFLQLLSKGKLSNPESIRRIRAKLQEENPSLRGSNYNARQAEQKNVREELGYKN